MILHDIFCLQNISRVRARLHTLLIFRARLAIALGDYSKRYNKTGDTNGAAYPWARSYYSPLPPPNTELSRHTSALPGIPVFGPLISCPSVGESKHFLAFLTRSITNHLASYGGGDICSPSPVPFSPRLPKTLDPQSSPLLNHRFCKAWYGMMRNAKPIVPKYTTIVPN